MQKALVTGQKTETKIIDNYLQLSQCCFPENSTALPLTKFGASTYAKLLAECVLLSRVHDRTLVNQASSIYPQFNPGLCHPSI